MSSAAASTTRAESRAAARASGVANGSLVALLCLVLLIAPLLWGATRDWGWPLLAVVVFILLAAWSLLDAVARHRTGLPAGFCFWAAGAWLAFVAIYLLPLPGPLVAILAPAVHGHYADIHATLPVGQDTYFLTLDRQATYQVLIKYCMYMAVFFLMAMLITTRARMTFMLAAILASGVLQVLLAVTAQTMGIRLTPTALMDGHWEVLRGTFVNRNHFAAFLAMTAAAGIGLLLANIKRNHDGGTVRSRVANLLDNLDWRPMLIGTALVPVGAGMILSTSRGGIAALGASLVLVLILALATRGWRARELVLVWPLGAAVVGAILWPGSSDLLNRLSSGLVLQERWVQWQGTLGLIADHRLTGTGPGTYVHVFTAYKDPGLRPLLYDHAHNDYLQLLAEQGVVGALLLSLVVLAIVYRLISSFAERRDALARGALFASLTGMGALFVHSLVEFNFQIPANALYFWALAGLGLAATRLPRGERTGYGRQRDNTSIKRITR